MIPFIYRDAVIVCASNSSIPASPERLRQRVSEPGSQGSRVWKKTSPVKNDQYGLCSQCQHTSSSDRSLACFRYNTRHKPQRQRRATTADRRSWKRR